MTLKEAIKVAKKTHKGAKPLRGGWAKNVTSEEGVSYLWYNDRYGSTHIVKMGEGWNN